MKPASDIKIATRLTIRSAYGSRKTVVVTTGPIPRVGDVLTLNGQDWSVIKAKKEEIFAEFSTEGGRLKQVFPRPSRPTSGKEKRS